MAIAGTIARNTTFNFFTIALEMVIGFVTGILLARSLGTEQYGLYAYLFWFLSLAYIIINLGLGEMTRRFIAEASGHQNVREQMGYVQLSLVLRTAMALVVCCVIVIFSGYWARLSGNPDDRLLFVLIALVMLPYTLVHTLIPIFKGYQKYEHAFWVMLTVEPLRCGLIIAIFILGFGIFEVLIVQIVVLTLGVLVGFFLLHRLLPLKSLVSSSLLSSTVRKRALRYSLIVAGTLALSYLVNEQAEVFFVGLFCTVDEVGFYNLAFRIAMMVGFLPSALSLVLLPTIAEQFGKREMESIKKIYITSARYVMMIALPMAAGGIALADSIIIFLYGVDYIPAIILLQVIFVPFTILTFTRACEAVIRGINRPGFILKTMAILAVAKIGLSLWLIPEYNVIGAAIASSIPRVIALPVFIIFVSKKIGVNWPLRDTIKVGLASAIMGLAVYALHSQLGVTISLVLCIPLGVIIYLIAIFVMRVINEQDLIVFKGIQDQLPMFLRKYYFYFIKLLERIIVKKKLPEGQ